MGKTVRFGMLRLLAGVMVLAFGGNALKGAERVVTPTSPRSGEDARVRVSVAASNLPLNFEQNVGQIQGPGATDVRYVARGSAYTIFLTPSEAVLEVGRRSSGPAGLGRPVVVRMRLSGGSRVPAYMGLDELPGTSNYLIGNDPEQWHTGIANYSRVTAMDVYPGIDLAYHGNQGQLEYDFVVAPQADPGRIRLRLEGTQGLRLDAEGNLLVKVEGGELCFRRPVAYQVADGAKRIVPVRYRLRGKRQVEFRLASYDTRQALVIDPILAYSTYLGGSNIDSGNGIAVAPDGTAFIAGGTFSANFPTAHPLQPNAGGPNDFPQDAFVTKISADGSTLVYSTYLGGKFQDVANGIAVDAAGEAFVVGTTLSPNFPVTPGAFNTLCGGDGECGASWNIQGFIVSNAFVAKLNTAGSGLVYSGFLGEYENVQGFAIAVDGAKNAYVTGATGPNIQETVLLTPPAVPPPPFPIVGGFEPTYDNLGTEYGGSGANAFIAKIDAAGDGILYSSYLGGNDETYGYGIAVDGNANAYVTGLTYSGVGFPLTSGTALQAIYGGAGDAFLTKVNTTTTGGGSLLYSTYLGGAGIDQGNGVAVDASGNAYVTGGTNSKTPLPFTLPGTPLQADCTLDSLGVCEGDAFVAKLNPTLSGAASLLYFTYLGGTLADSGTGIAVDSAGDAYIAGTTVSTNFPIAGAVFQPTYGGGNADAFVSELNPAATALVYSSYLGGSNTDTGSGIAIDISGSAYVTGQTCSLDFPLSNPEQAAYAGNCDAFVSKLIQSGGVSVNPAGLIFPTQNVGQPSPAETVTLTNGDSVALTINGIAIAGADSSDFTIQTNTCGSTVGPTGTCKVGVIFSPTSATPPERTAKLTFTDTEAGGSQVSQVIDLTGTAGALPIVTLSPANLTFSASQGVGVASPPLTLTVTNTGTGPLTITSAVASGEFAIAASGNTCTAPLQVTTPPSNCTIAVTFTPTVAGPSVGSLTLTDNAPNSPQVILLTGTGIAAPVLTITPTALTFGSQAVGTSSAPQMVTLSNSGTGSLSITGIVASGAFSQTNSCGTTVAGNGGSCIINVVFTPTVAGASTGALTITDSAAGSPQVVSLTGGGANFSIAITPTSATVVAGSSATITVAVSSVSGFNSPVNFTCSGLPALANCSATPVTPSGTSPVTTNLTIATTQRTSAPPGGSPRPYGPAGGALRHGLWILWAFLLLGITGWAARQKTFRWSFAALGVLALWLLSFAACGSGGTGYVNPTGTPAGTYTVTVTGASAGLKQTANITLIVQ